MSTTNIAEAINDIVDSLKAAGLAATADPSKLELPGVLVMPGLIEFPYLDGSQFDQEFNLYLLTSPKGGVENWVDLQDLLQKTRSVYEIPEALPVSVPLPNHSTGPVPALLVTLKTTIS
jgi:hypothetical protein